jgi:hypothetical protein
MTRTYFAREVAIYCQAIGLGIFEPISNQTRNLYLGELPDDATEAIWMVEVPSPPPHEYVATEYTVIDFWARSPHTDRAHALLDDVFQALDRRVNYDTANWHISFSHALGSIVDADRDAEGGKLLRLSIQFYCKNLRLVS